MPLHVILNCLVEVGFQIELEFHFEIALEKLEKEKNKFLLIPLFWPVGLFSAVAFSSPRRPASLLSRGGPLGLALAPA